MLITLDNRIFGLDPQLLFQVAFQALAIFILFMAASYLLLDPVRKILNDRKEKVMRDQKEAETNREQAEAFKAEYDAKLKDINKTAESILTATRQKALAKETEIVADAKAEAARIIAAANQEAELEKQRVKDEVKQEMISVASLMSEKIIGAAIDAEKQDALIEQTLKEIGDETWLS